MHPDLGIKGSCMDTYECASQGGIYEAGWCMSKPENVKCCFITQSQPKK